MLSDCAFQLNPRLNAEAIAVEFRRSTRIQVPDVFLSDAASALYRDVQSLEKTLVTRADEKGEALANDRLPTAPGAGFSYAYERAVPKQGENAFAEFVVFLNSSPFKAFVETVTGMGGVQGVSAQITCFGPGHFLNLHSDSLGGRSIAYVFNLTPEWKAIWGGVLQFADDDGSICDSFIPRFNTLSLFAVPQLHCVSMIVPRAPAIRYAISGWLYRDAQ